MRFTGSMRRRVIAAIAMLWASGVLGSSTGVAGGLRAHRVEDRYTPLVQSVVSPPKWFEGTDGRVHLVYELESTNGIPAPVTVSSVVVRDAGGGRVIARLHGPRLHAAMSLLATPGTSTTTVPASSIGVVWFDIALRSRRELPRTIEHAVTWTVPPGLPLPETGTDTGARARVDSRPPVVLGPPLAGAGWVAVGSCCDGPHRRSLQPVNGKLYLGQRFAIDWNGMDSQGRFVVGDPDINASWVFYGKPVLAVADASVVRAVDRFPDQIPNHPKPVTLEQADGNYVILALGDRRFAFYAHLKPGSIRVRRGDRVRRGEVIAQLGNSGSSTGPHLHFQVMNRPSALASDGLPFVIDRFRFDGQIPPFDPSLEADINAGKSIPVDSAGAGGRGDELPLGRDVVGFSPS
jgi:murein DD-endopeptidase MepM/ murein hydrolase activator NlpD